MEEVNTVSNINSENVDFSKNGPFSKTSGAGTISKIKERLIEEIDLFSCRSYDDFKLNYTMEGGLLDKYQGWLRNNTLG